MVLRMNQVKMVVLGIVSLYLGIFAIHMGVSYKSKICFHIIQHKYLIVLYVIRTFFLWESSEEQENLTLLYKTLPVYVKLQLQTIILQENNKLLTTPVMSS